MSGARRVLILGGLALAAFGMLYGLHYALFVEHQTLERIGISMTEAFAQAAGSNWTRSEDAIRSYATTKYDYVRQVDAHSHWIGLAMLMIVLGAAFDRVRFSGRVQLWLAVGLLSGSVLFPLGVILQTVRHGSILPLGITVFGTGLVTLALAAIAWGFWRRPA